MESSFIKLQKFSELFDYGHDNDREIVIVGCAYIESLVKEILENSLLNNDKEKNNLLNESSGALSSLIPRARLLYLLNIIPEIVFNDIKIIGKIRNEFAHNIEASFDDNKIKQYCKNLKWHVHSLFMIAPADATAREIYQVGVNQLVTHLIALPDLQKSKRKS